jgi:hypothetical protein
MHLLSLTVLFFARLLVRETIFLSAAGLVEYPSLVLALAGQVRTMFLLNPNSGNLSALDNEK